MEGGKLDAFAKAEAASFAAQASVARSSAGRAAAGKPNTLEDERRAALRAGFDTSTTKAQTLGQAAPKLGDPVKKEAVVGSKAWKEARLDSFAKAYGGAPSSTVKKGKETTKASSVKKKPAAEATPAT